jgi:hypothetical protein
MQKTSVLLLVDDRVDGDGGLARLAVADDELALAAADRDHRVDGLEAGLHRLVHRLAGHDAGRLELDAAELVGLDRALAVDGLAERVHDATEQPLPTGTWTILPVRLAVSPSRILLAAPRMRDADVVLFEVEHHAANHPGTRGAHRPWRCRDHAHARCRHRP